VRTGIGLRSEHYQDVIAERPAVGFFEIYSENCFGPGAAPHRYFETIHADYPLSFHGVGMSLGSVDPLNYVNVTNLNYVNVINHDFDPQTFLSGIPAQLLKEIYLAGHTVNEFEDGAIPAANFTIRACLNSVVITSDRWWLGARGESALSTPAATGVTACRGCLAALSRGSEPRKGDSEYRVGTW
jgi:uncharacterized protein (UPF0276 family)